MRRKLTHRLTAWYMGRIAGRCCPCEWPVKSRLLIRLCGKIDDAHARHDFYRLAEYWQKHWYSVTSGTSTSSSGATVTWSDPPTLKH